MIITEVKAEEIYEFKQEPARVADACTGAISKADLKLLDSNRTTGIISARAKVLNFAGEYRVVLTITGIEGGTRLRVQVVESPGATIGRAQKHLAEFAKILFEQNSIKTSSKAGW